jgi:hypothetical protein
MPHFLPALTVFRQTRAIPSWRRRTRDGVDGLCGRQRDVPISRRFALELGRSVREEVAPNVDVEVGG